MRIELFLQYFLASCVFSSVAPNHEKNRAPVSLVVEILLSVKNLLESSPSFYFQNMGQVVRDAKETTESGSTVGRILFCEDISGALRIELAAGLPRWVI